MATFFREVSFRTAGEDARVAAADRLDALPDLRVLFERQRELGMLERDRLFGVEHHNTLVLEIAVDAELEEFEMSPGDDPYRYQDLEVIRRLRPDLGELLHELGASQRVIASGILNFETRVYERDLCERYALELRSRCTAEGLDAELHVVETSRIGGHRLSGRIRGTILEIERVAHDLRTSGYVPFGRAVVKYL